MQAVRRLHRPAEFTSRRILGRVTQAPPPSRGRERNPTNPAPDDVHNGPDRLMQVIEELRDDVRELHRRVAPDAGPFDRSRSPAADGRPPPAVPAWRKPTRGEQRWEVTIAVALMIVLQLTLPGDLTPIGRWTLPIIELAIAVILVAANPLRIERSSPILRTLSLGLITVAGLANASAVVLLIRDLVQGNNGDDPAPLLATGANIWLTNVIIFALLYWEFDRGGPAARAAGARPRPDFLFPQMADDSGIFRAWEPRFSDYAYVSFTNATAFSPTDTMPMTRWTKLAMMLQSAVSLVTAALVIARAVNILK